MISFTGVEWCGVCACVLKAGNLSTRLGKKIIQYCIFISKEDRMPKLWAGNSKIWNQAELTTKQQHVLRVLHRHKLLLLQHGPYYGLLLELHALTLAARPYVLLMLAMSVFLLGTAEKPDTSGNSPAAKKRRVDGSSSRAGNTVRTCTTINWSIHSCLVEKLTSTDSDKTV